VPKEVMKLKGLFLFNLNQKGARAETDMYKKNIRIPVGQENRFTGEVNLKFMLSVKRINETIY
jgi:hypothetical protein